jgi:hypothetical protein
MEYGSIWKWSGMYNRRRASGRCKDEQEYEAYLESTDILLYVHCTTSAKFNHTYVNPDQKRLFWKGLHGHEHCTDLESSRVGHGF